MEFENKNNNILDDLDLRNRNWQKIEDNQINITNEIKNGNFNDGIADWAVGNGVTVTDSVAHVPSESYHEFRQNYDSLKKGVYYVNLKYKNVDSNFYVQTRKDFEIEEEIVIPNNDDFSKSGFRFENINSFDKLYIIRINNFGGGIYIDEINLINLTQTFGAGNEPTKEQMDKLMEIIGWFDGTKTLTQLEQLNWLLALNRQQAQITDGLVGV